MISCVARAGGFEMNKNRALKLALGALEQIAFAEMQPSIEMSDKAIEKWHARKAWKFIEIAKSKLKPIKEALAQPPEPRNFCPRCGKRTADLTVIHTCTPPRELEMT